MTKFFSLTNQLFCKSTRKVIKSTKKLVVQSTFKKLNKIMINNFLYSQNKNIIHIKWTIFLTKYNSYELDVYNHNHTFTPKTIDENKSKK